YSVRIGAPFLSLDLFSGFVTVEPGDSERVTVSYANLGIGTAAHVWINLTLPNEVVYLADDAGPAPAVLGSTWSWHATSVPTGVRLFHVDLRIASWASDGRNIHLLAWLNGTDASGNRVNGSAGSIGFLVRTAAITVEAIVPIQEGIPGEDVVVTVFLNNTGSRTAVLVWLNLSYGSGLVFLGDHDREDNPAEDSQIGNRLGTGSRRRVGHGDLVQNRGHGIVLSHEANRKIP